MRNNCPAVSWLLRPVLSATPEIVHMAILVFKGTKHLAELLTVPQPRQTEREEQLRAPCFTLSFDIQHWVSPLRFLNLDSKGLQ